MSQTIHLVNEYQGVLDLSAVNDVEGKRVVLQPKGHPGAERECFAEVEEHPHVITMLNAARMTIRRGASMSAVEAPAPAAAPPPPAPEPEPVPAPAPEALADEVAAKDSLDVSTTDASAVVVDEEPAPLPSPPSSSSSKKKGRF